MGAAFKAERNFPAAEEWTRRALLLDPSNIAIKGNLANILSRFKSFGTQVFYISNVLEMVKTKMHPAWWQKLLQLVWTFIHWAKFMAGTCRLDNKPASYYRAVADFLAPISRKSRDGIYHFKKGIQLHVCTINRFFRKREYSIFLLSI